jgi:hypothetical protein
VVGVVAGLILGVGLLVVGGRGSAGHQVSHYPSYYPDEIRIDALDPRAAAKGLVEETLHAYVGATPHFDGPLPAHVKAVESLGSLLILSFNSASPRFASRVNRCAAARDMLAALASVRIPEFVFHPYPIIPYHPDYLHHIDRIKAAAVTPGGSGSVAPLLKIGAKGQLAEAVVRAVWTLTPDSDAVLEEVQVDEIIPAGGAQIDGRAGSPWVKEGWFQAYHLLVPRAGGEQGAVREAYHALAYGEARSLAEHANLERQLLAALMEGCERVVVGYTLRREFVNDAYPPGIENIAYDSLGGLNAPVFVRTVKLKDYPWNGKLQLGIPYRAEAAWNPVGGFTDPVGRLVWAAVGDPAMIPFPFNGSWMPNRVQAEVTKVQGQSGGFKVPADALRPEPGSGTLQRVGDWTFASAKVVYDVLASPFEDGTEMGVADLLYPYAFTQRWGAGKDDGGKMREPRLGPVLAALEDRLIGVKLLRIDQTTHAVAEGMNILVKTPVLEVYLKDVPSDERQVAALAAPWSTVPWHLLVLMEEAVARGYAAFSQEEAARRRVPWLDLVRDPILKGKLQELAADFERIRFRPETLKDLVSPEEAQARWRALRAFAEKQGHFLVTNGPYRLKEWTSDKVVLEAVRDLTYPLGFGTFDRFVNPPRAVIQSVTQKGGTITVRAEAEMVLKMGRKYGLVKEPLLRTTTRGVQGLLVVSRYLLIDPDGKVVKVDKMQWKEDGQFAIELPERLPAGQYTVLIGIFLDGNTLQPSTRTLHVRVGAAGNPG